eukprot:gnl/Dysnectes_brevis/4831_a6679_592.p1 GENE.gnl/Dysnectes_brevis/4831_a6679_592~~gnl/Dysnectes_brevis/4831_a6679_592.p1  ORF type:complete len:1030 (+),score=210.99 gnl/Dysnectes_brevis/4831_a6679_592:28-3117(+)
MESDCDSDGGNTVPSVEISVEEIISTAESEGIILLEVYGTSLARVSNVDSDTLMREVPLSSYGVFLIIVTLDSKSKFKGHGLFSSGSQFVFVWCGSRSRPDARAVGSVWGMQLCQGLQSPAGHRVERQAEESDQLLSNVGMITVDDNPRDTPASLKAVPTRPFEFYQIKEDKTDRMKKGRKAPRVIKLLSPSLLHLPPLLFRDQGVQEQQFSHPDGRSMPRNNFGGAFVLMQPAGPQKGVYQYLPPPSEHVAAATPAERSAALHLAVKLRIANPKCPIHLLDFRSTASSKVGLELVSRAPASNFFDIILSCDPNLSYYPEGTTLPLWTSLLPAYEAIEEEENEEDDVWLAHGVDGVGDAGCEDDETRLLRVVIGDGGAKSVRVNVEDPADEEHSPLTDPCKSMLDPHGVFLLLHGDIAFVWHGSAASDLEGRLATAAAHRLFGAEGMTVQGVIMRAEPASFTVAFPCWTDEGHYGGDGEASSSAESSPASTTLIETRDPPISEDETTTSGPFSDLGSLWFTPPHPSSLEEEEDAEGTTSIRMFHLHDSDVTVVEEDATGHFNSFDAHVVVLDRGKGSFLLYLWVGRYCTAQPVLSFYHSLLPQLQRLLTRQGGSRPSVHRIMDGQEPLEFLRLFPQAMIVHHGGESTKFLRHIKPLSVQERSTRVYRVWGPPRLPATAREVVPGAPLSSRDAWIVTGRGSDAEETALWLVYGQHCQKTVRDAAFNLSFLLLPSDAPDEAVEEVESGEESEELKLALTGIGFDLETHVVKSHVHLNNIVSKPLPPRFVSLATIEGLSFDTSKASESMEIDAGSPIEPRLYRVRRKWCLSGSGGGQQKKQSNACPLAPLPLRSCAMLPTPHVLHLGTCAYIWVPSTWTSCVETVLSVVSQVFTNTTISIVREGEEPLDFISAFPDFERPYVELCARHDLWEARSRLVEWVATRKRGIRMQLEDLKRQALTGLDTPDEERKLSRHYRRLVAQVKRDVFGYSLPPLSLYADLPSESLLTPPTGGAEPWKEDDVEVMLRANVTE